MMFAVLILAGSLSAAIRLDIGANSQRNDTGAKNWQEWPVDSGVESAQTRAGDVTIRLRPVGAAKLESVLSKTELAIDLRLVCDNVFVTNGAIEVVLQGLPAGQHTITTYHNLVGTAKASGAYRVSLVGGQQTATVTPSSGLTHDDDVATAHLGFDAPGNADVVIRIEAATKGEVDKVVLTGLVIDEADPQRQAVKPTPFDGDNHADADNGRVQFSWKPSPTARSHRVYLSRAKSASEAAAALTASQPDAKLLVGWTNEPRFSADVVDHDSLMHYAWRVDEIGADNVATPGRTWSFRTRQRAFPGAEGYGRFAIGGRGGRVFIVTNLNDSGPGSLREAVEATGPRTVVFEVGGLISLRRPLTIRNPFITIAGQTAPGKGICTRNYTVGGFGSRDVIMRYVRIRVGDLANMSMDGTGLASCDHCIFDHLSISWGLDESISTRGAGNVTIQRTLVAEALLHGPRFSGGYAGSLGGNVLSMHHNLLTHNAGRNWSLAGALDKAGRHTGRLDIRNNVVYNWQKRTNDGGAMQVQIVNNYYKPGPASKVFHILDPERNHVFGPQDYYVAGNIVEGHVTADNDWGGIVEPKNEKLTEFVYRKPFFESYVTTHSAAEAYENVLADVGCNVPMLDDHDARCIRETRTGTTTYTGSLTKTPGVVNSQQDVGGIEDHPETRHPAGWDTDRDGMPDAWEKARGLNPNDPADGAKDPDGDGYTSLEEYLASLVRK
jgi:hypothetical protein